MWVMTLRAGDKRANPEGYMSMALMPPIRSADSPAAVAAALLPTRAGERRKREGLVESTVLTMHALDSLRHDLEQMRLLNEVLVHYAARLLAGNGARPGDLDRLARTARNVAERRHFAKHEQVLFPVLACSGFGWGHPSLQDVRNSHALLRKLIGALEEAAPRATGWSPHERRRAVATALDLANAQSRLIDIEEVELFPALTTCLAPEALTELAQLLTRFDEHIERLQPCALVSELHRVLTARDTSASSNIVERPLGAADGAAHAGSSAYTSTAGR